MKHLNLNLNINLNLNLNLYLNLIYLNSNLNLDLNLNYFNSNLNYLNLKWSCLPPRGSYTLEKYSILSRRILPTDFTPNFRRIFRPIFPSTPKIRNFRRRRISAHAEIYAEFYERILRIEFSAKFSVRVFRRRRKLLRYLNR